MAIFNFHSGELINNIFVGYGGKYGICLWNHKYIFVGCNKKLKLVRIKDGKTMKSFNEHSKNIITIRKIIHPKYREGLLSKGLEDDQIKLWINKNE